MHVFKNMLARGNHLIIRALIPLTFCVSSAAYAEDLTASQTLCAASIGSFNQQFTTIKPLDASGDMPVDSGLIVHTIHGPGMDPAELNMTKLNALPVDLGKTCGDFMTAANPVFLPWCGSNRNVATQKLSDASSWTFIRHDTLINASAQQPTNEVVCEPSNNKRYGLIFNNSYMNGTNTAAARDNLGCMYPLDGDTGNRTQMGCGISQNPGIPQPVIKQEGHGTCPLTDDKTAYLGEFDKLLGFSYRGKSYASVAGSMVCSLPKSKFDLWVDVRKNVNLSQTTWPVNEFVLWNWDTYTTADLAKNDYITGIYYMSDCASTYDGTRAEAQEIADLYKKWTGVELPVVNLSNAALHKKNNTPFSCR